MKKTVLSLLFMMSYSATAAEVVLEKNGVQLTDEEITIAANDLSERELSDMRSNPAMLRTFIERIFDGKVMAKSIREKLADDKNHKILRQMMLDRFDNQYYVKRQVLEKIDAVKDFKTLAKQTYQSRIKDYQLPQTADYYHILFVKQDGVDNKTVAEGVLEAIKANETTLAEASKKYHSKLAGTNEEGVLEKVDSEKLMKEIKQAIATLKVGEMTEVVETDAGYHIIGLKQVNPVETTPYDAQIETALTNELKNNMYRATDSEIRKSYQGPEGLVVNEALLQSTTDKILKAKK